MVSCTRCLAIFVALAVLPLPALAQGVDPIDTYLLAATRLYENLEYERGLEQLKQARRHSRGVQDDATISLWEGILLADMGQPEEASAAFKAGLFLDPEAALPTKVSPKISSSFERLRIEVKEELAPILAKQAAERLAAEKLRQEEARRLAEAQAAAEKAEADRAKVLAQEQAKREAEAQAAREQEEAVRVAAQKARLAAEKQKTDAARAEAARLAAKLEAADRARKAAEERARAADRKRREEKARAESAARERAEALAAVRAEQAGTTAAPPPDLTAITEPDPAFLPPTEPEKRRSLAAPMAFGGVALAAGGTGAFFGLRSNKSVDSARAAAFQDEATGHLDVARKNALAANILFAAAGTAAVVTVVTWLSGR